MRGTTDDLLNLLESLLALTEPLRCDLDSKGNSEWARISARTADVRAARDAREGRAVKTFTLFDQFGPFLTVGFAKLPHALRATKKRASAWGRTIYLTNGVTVWKVTPKRQITRRD